VAPQSGSAALTGEAQRQPGGNDRDTRVEIRKV